MELRSNTRAVTAGDQRGASNRTDRRIGEGVLKDQPITGESLDVGSRRTVLAEELQVVHRVVL